MASNAVYYSQKARNGGSIIAPAKTPGNVKRFLGKLDKIVANFMKLCAASETFISDKNGDGRVQVDLTTYIYISFWNDWLQRERGSLCAEAKEVYHSSMAQGILWEPGIIKNVENHIIKIASDVSSFSQVFLDIFKNSLVAQLKPNEVDIIKKFINERRAILSINEFGKLVDPDRKKPIILHYNG